MIPPGLPIYPTYNSDNKPGTKHQSKPLPADIKPPANEGLDASSLSGKNITQGAVRNPDDQSAPKGWVQMMVDKFDEFFQIREKVETAIEQIEKFDKCISSANKDLTTNDLQDLVLPEEAKFIVKMRTNSKEDTSKFSFANLHEINRLHDKYFGKNTLFESRLSGLNMVRNMWPEDSNFLANARYNLKTSRGRECIEYLYNMHKRNRGWAKTSNIVNHIMESKVSYSLSKGVLGFWKKIEKGRGERPMLDFLVDKGFLNDKDKVLLIKFQKNEESLTMPELRRMVTINNEVLSPIDLLENVTVEQVNNSRLPSKEKAFLTKKIEKYKKDPTSIEKSDLKILTKVVIALAIAKKAGNKAIIPTQRNGSKTSARATGEVNKNLIFQGKITSAQIHDEEAKKSMSDLKQVFDTLTRLEVNMGENRSITVLDAFIQSGKLNQNEVATARRLLGYFDGKVLTESDLQELEKVLSKLKMLFQDLLGDTKDKDLAAIKKKIESWSIGGGIELDQFSTVKKSVEESARSSIEILGSIFVVDDKGKNLSIIDLLFKESRLSREEKAVVDKIEGGQLLVEKEIPVLSTLYKEILRPLSRIMDKFNQMDLNEVQKLLDKIDKDEEKELFKAIKEKTIAPGVSVSHSERVGYASGGMKESRIIKALYQHEIPVREGNGIQMRNIFELFEANGKMTKNDATLIATFKNDEAWISLSKEDSEALKKLCNDKFLAVYEAFVSNDPLSEDFINNLNSGGYLTREQIDLLRESFVPVRDSIFNVLSDNLTLNNLSRIVESLKNSNLRLEPQTDTVAPRLPPRNSRQSPIVYSIRKDVEAIVRVCSLNKGQIRELTGLLNAL